MIIKEHQLEKIVRDSKKFLNILIYGPNEGLVREQIEKLTMGELDLKPEGTGEVVDINGWKPKIVKD